MIETFESLSLKIQKRNEIQNAKIDSDQTLGRSPSPFENHSKT